MIKKIKSSLSIKIFLGIMTVLVAVSLLVYGSLRILMPRAFESEQSEQFTANLNTLATRLESIPIDNINSYITDFAINNQSSVSVYDSENIELVYINFSSDESPSDNEVVSGAINYQNDGKTYSLVAKIPSSSVDQLSGTFAHIFPYIIVIIFFLSALAAFLYSRIIARPIVSISNISKKMTALDMTWRCNIVRSDEIGVLASSLNTMAEKLEYTLEELKSANEKLQGDIERERQQEKQRIDFFRAVSHELKTPITVLKGELEGVIYAIGEYKDRDTYLRDCMRTVIEIENMVKEILSVSRMGSDDFSMSVTEVNIGQLITNCCRKLQGTAEDKTMTFMTDIETPFFYCGNEAMLKKAFSNIIVNAVFHSPGGATITVSLKDGVFCVENTGVHIEQADIEQIYQPFYRVDQSHNRNTGGSGLGLYIVKTVFDRHGLDYKIENSDIGVRFTVFF